MAVLGHDALGVVDALLVVVQRLPVQEHDDIGVLLDGPRFPEVGQHGLVFAAALDAPGQLGQGDHRDVQFLGHQLQVPGHLRNLLDTVLDVPAAGHQLEVVDDHQPQVLDPPQLCLDIRHRGDGVVIHVYLGGGQGLGGLCQVHPVVVGEGAGEQLLQFHQRLGGKEPLGQLLLAHLQGEDGHRLARLFGHVAGDVQGKGGLAHAGAGGDEDKVRLVQPGDHGVQQLIPGGEPQVILPVLPADALEVVVGLHQHLGQGEDGAHLPPLADVVDALLGKLQQFHGVGLGVEGVVHHLPAGGDEAAQVVLFLDDGGVGPHVGGGGHHLGQLGQVDLGVLRGFEDLLPPGVLQHRHHVDGPAHGEHLDHHGEQLLVLGPVEILRLQQFHHRRDAARVQQQRPQDALLRLQAVWHRLAVDIQAGLLGHLVPPFQEQEGSPPPLLHFITAVH